MIAFLNLFLHILVSPFKTQARLEAEISVLRHQLMVAIGGTKTVRLLVAMSEFAGLGP
jgi:hypothetical protein